MAKVMGARNPARAAKAKGSKARFAKGKGAKAKPFGKAKPVGKAKPSGKHFYSGTAARPAEGRRAASAPKGPRKGLKAAALRPRPELAPRKAPAPARAARASTPVAATSLPPDEGQVRALAAVAAGFDKMAEDAVIMDVRGLSGVADYFVVLSADSDRQAAAVADFVDDRLTSLGAQRLGAEGKSGGGWVLLDFGDVVIHVMSPTSRGFYDLEGLWADAPRVRIPT
jgi:ribosome-associated protein